MQAAGGEAETVYKQRFNPGAAAPFDVTTGPVGRLLVDLGNPGEGRWVVSTGVSGWPGSPHYGDQLERWSRGELLPMRFDWEAVRAHAQGVWTLVP